MSNIQLICATFVVALVVICVTKCNIDYFGGNFIMSKLTWGVDGLGRCALCYRHGNEIIFQGLS